LVKEVPDSIFEGDDLKWIPCSEPVRLNQNCIADRGDVFIQKYDFMKCFAKDVAQESQNAEMVSVWLETYINIDARYDTKRGQTLVHSFDNNAVRVNMAYSQKDNFFTYNSFDDNLFDNDDMPSTFT
jgi:hypothetical protein